MKSIELKIKLKHLAEEARINRAEAKKQYAAGQYATGNSLTNHRKAVIRPEARATLLAYQYLRGKSYAECENSAKTQPQWGRVKAMVKKYGEADLDIKAWKDGKENLSVIARISQKYDAVLASLASR